jgi:hypothetical protein
VAAEYSREVVEPTPAPLEPGTSSIACPLTIIAREAARCVSATALESDPSDT